MASWVKITFERDIYAIDLDRVSAYANAPNGKITFWLPNSSIPIILHPQTNPESYQTIQDYISKQTGYSLGSHWLKMNYDRCDYLIDLNCISTFCCEPNSKKITFWLPDSTTPIVLHPQAHSEAYTQVIDYIEQTTGYSIP